MTSGGPTVLLITNQPQVSHAVGHEQAYRTLVDAGYLASVDIVSWRGSNGHLPQGNLESVLTLLETRTYDVVVVWSSGHFPGTRASFDRLNAAMKSATLLYWEGDSWGRGKPVTREMRWWLQRADVVISASGDPQPHMLLNAGAREVRFSPQVVDEGVFATEYSSNWSPPATSRGAIMIGSYEARIPIIGGMPGDGERRRLARALRKRFGGTFTLRGRGWPSSWAVSPVAYEGQVREIATHRVSANWDHYPRYADSSSDRLPIALLAGRPHVAGRHPGMEWLPGPEVGFFQESTVSAVVDRVGELIDDPQRCARLGAEGRRWVVGRLCAEQAVRYHLSLVLDEVPAPTIEPWTALPGPWRL